MKMYREDYYLDEDEEIARRKRKWKRVLLRIMLTIAILTTVVVGFFLLFHIRKISVSGNQYCTEDEIKGWIETDEYATNSVYVWWKYNFTKVKQLPLVEASEISFVSPWNIKVRVYEKSIVGYLDYDGTHVFFDKDGVVALETADPVEGVPCIEGVATDLASIVVHEPLPVSDDSVFSDIFAVSQALQKESLTPDRIVMGENSDVTLYFGNVVVTLGTSGFADKMEQIPPILAKLSELYPGQGGTLHLENYSETQTSINFTPEESTNE